MINEKMAKRFCCEDISLIENYNEAINDTTQTWHCHHRDEIQPDGTVLHINDLMLKGEYFHIPASKLIFLTKKDHHNLHNKANWIGRKHSDESCKKISESHKGKEPWIKGKKMVYSDKWHKNLSKAMKGKPKNKRLWLTLNGEVKEMCANIVSRYHKDWILVK